jgi:NifU-like protein
MVKGMSVEEALKVSNQDIADFLEGLPPEKMHCSVMGREALEAAIANYRGEEWVDDHEEGALICKCFAIDEVMIEKAIRENGLTTVEDVTNYTKAGGGCSSCHEGIEEVLDRVMAESPEAVAKPAPAPVEPAPAPVAASGGMTNLQRMRRIEEILEEIRPMLQRDHGDVELVDIDGKTVYVNMIGACSGCQMASMTLQGIQQKLMEELGEFIKVVPASQMPKPAMGA